MSADSSSFSLFPASPGSAPVVASAAAGADDFAAMDRQRRYCHGMHQSGGPFPPNYWVVPTGMTMKADTRCAHCQVLFDLHAGTFPDVSMPGLSINCDSASDLSLTTLAYSGFRVGLARLGMPDIPLYLDPENRHKAKAGVGIFVVPTQTQFQIKIERIPGAVFDTFAIEEAVAASGEAIVINDGRKILYDSGTATIAGFATDSDRSFLFVAPSEWEKANAPEARVAATLSESNIFTLKLQPYTRKSNPVAQSSGFSFGGFGASGATAPEPSLFGGGSGLFFGGGGKTTYGRGVPGASSSSSSLGAFDAVVCTSSMTTGFGFGGGGGAAAVGGATVSGGTHIDHVATRAATDTYTKIGEPVVIQLQLVCRQSDEHRKRDNLRARLHQDGLDYWRNKVESATAWKTILEEQLAEATSKWDDATQALNAVTERNAALIAQLQPPDLTVWKLDPSPTAQVKADLAARAQATKSAMLLDV